MSLGPDGCVLNQPRLHLMQARQRWLRENARPVSRVWNHLQPRFLGPGDTGSSTAHWVSGSLFVIDTSRGPQQAVCLSRLNQARIDAKREDRDIRDGEVVTACEAVCPADAIVFGNLNDPNSRVTKLKAQERNYGVLEDLGTRPRTSYLAALRNPNPEMPKPAQKEGA